MLFIGALLSPTSILAQANNGLTNPVLSDTLLGMTGVEYFQSLLTRLIGIAFVIGAIIFFFMLVIGGIQWITSGGDKEAVIQARGRITNALIGLVILFSTFAIVVVVEIFFGIDILTIDIGPLIIS